MLDFDPLMDNGDPLTRFQGYNAPGSLTSQYINDAGTASAGLVSHRIVRWSLLRTYPAKPAHWVVKAYALKSLRDLPPAEGLAGPQKKKKPAAEPEQA